MKKKGRPITMQMDAGYAVAALKSEAYPDPNERLNWLQFDDGTRPTVAEAIEFLSQLDPKTIITKD